MIQTEQTAPRTPKASAVRQEILGIAARQMRDVGYAQMSLRQLAADAGMKAGSLYYHFASKETLATEVMRLGVEGVQKEVEDALIAHANASPRDRLIVAMRVHLQALLSAEDFSSAHIRCYPFVPENVRVELTGTRRKYDRIWTNLIAIYLGKDADDDAVRHLHHILIGSLNWSLEWFKPNRDSVDNYINSLADLLPTIAE